MDGLPTVAPNLRNANSEPSRPTRYSTSSENSDDNRSESRLSHFSNGGGQEGDQVVLIIQEVPLLLEEMQALELYILL